MWSGIWRHCNSYKTCQSTASYTRMRKQMIHWCIHKFKCNIFIDCGEMVLITHRGWMSHVIVRKLSHHWFRWWLVAYSAPNHYMNQCFHIVDPRNKFQLWTPGTNFSEFLIKMQQFSTFRKSIWSCSLQNGGHSISASMYLWFGYVYKNMCMQQYLIMPESTQSL